MRDMALAWHVAAFSRARKLPPLEGILARVRQAAERARHRRPQTWREQLAVIETINAMFGGADPRKHRKD